MEHSRYAANMLRSLGYPATADAALAEVERWERDRARHRDALLDARTALRRAMMRYGHPLAEHGLLCGCVGCEGVRAITAALGEGQDSDLAEPGEQGASEALTVCTVPFEGATDVSGLPTPSPGSARPFAGVPYQHQANGGSCTCSATARTGQPVVFDNSRCPIHSPAARPLGECPCDGDRGCVCQ